MAWMNFTAKTEGFRGKDEMGFGVRICKSELWL